MTIPRKYADMDWDHWVPRESATLVFVRMDGMVLLIRKLQGMGAGLLNGPGGRIDPTDATARDGAIREAREELCITPHDVRKAGELWFQFRSGYSLRCHVFTAGSYDGTPTATPEAIPLWVDERDIPYGQMWADDRLWFPLLLEGRPFLGRFLFEDSTLLGCDIDVAPLPPAPDPPPPSRA